ncbi:MAG: NYN domain-containing protein, partial [Pseudomonadota bacterium]
VKIKHTEEKGSDVNLGVHLVRDGFTDAFDVAYVLTNDTDLVEPIRIVTEEIGKEVVIVAPCRYFTKGKYRVPLPSKSLFAVSDRTHYIDDHELAAAQFPRSIPRLGKKPIIRPDSWVKA